VGDTGPSLGEPGEAVIDFRELLGGMNVGYSHGLDGLQGAAEHVAEGRVRPQEALGGDVDNDHAVGGGLEENAVSSLRLSERLLALPGHLFGLKTHEGAAHHGGNGLQSGMAITGGQFLVRARGEIQGPNDTAMMTDRNQYHVPYPHAAPDVSPSFGDIVDGVGAW